MLAPNDEKNAVVNLVNVYDWVMLPIEIGKEYYQTGEIDLTRFPVPPAEWIVQCSVCNAEVCAMVLSGCLS